MKLQLAPFFRRFWSITVIHLNITKKELLVKCNLPTYQHPGQVNAAHLLQSNDYRFGAFPNESLSKVHQESRRLKIWNWIIQYYKPTLNPIEIIKSLFLMVAPLYCKSKIQTHVISCCNIWLTSLISLASLSLSFFKEILTVQMLQQFTSMTSRDSCYTSSRWEGCRNTELFFLELYHRILCSLKRIVKIHRIWLMPLL